MILKRKTLPSCFIQTSASALFIDGANLYATARGVGFDIDYRRLLHEFQGRGYLIRAYYYTALVEDQEDSSIRPLIDWLDYNGYTVVTKPTKEFIDAGPPQGQGQHGHRARDRRDGARRAHRPHGAVLGRRRFPPLVEAMQRKGVRVTVVSTVTTQPPMIADELRRQADQFLDLADLSAKIGRDPAERVAREARRRRRDRHHAGAVSRRSPAVAAAYRRRTARPRDCPLCPRLVAFREEQRAKRPDWHNAPVPSFGDAGARLLIVGLAPGLQGANRTGRPFTGDWAGDLLYATLLEFGFADGRL